MASYKYSPFGEKNITSAIMRNEITGRGIRSVRRMPQDLFKRLDEQYNGMPSIIVELEEALFHQDASKCKSSILRISRRLCEVTNLQFNLHREWFILLHGPEVLVRLLRHPPSPKAPHHQHHPHRFSTSSPSSSSSSSFSGGGSSTSSSSSSSSSNRTPPFSWIEHNSEPQRTRSQCMAILRELCFSNVQVAEWLATDESLIILLFSLLGDRRTFDSAISLIEEILCVKDDTFNLANIPNFTPLMRSLSKSQLGIFCRAIAMVIFEPDEKNTDEIISSLELLSSRRRDRITASAVKNIDRNHAIILGVPDLLERLVRLLKASNSPNCRWTEHLIFHFPNATDLLALHRNVAVESDFDWADLPVDDSPSASNHDEEPEYDEGEFAMPDDGTQSLKSLALSTYQVELVFVLYALLSGKRKAELQDRLARAGLIPTLTTMFDQINWMKQPTIIPPHERMHGPGCECNPDSALKIHLLRLILNFTDGDSENRENKKLLLSMDEQATLCGCTDTRKEGQDAPGLLTKLINVFYKLPSDQNYRFWIASCIEAFLRGSPASYQQFVAKAGLLRYLAHDIVGDAVKCAGSLQTSFDLLGELMKFNRGIFQQFNAVLSDVDSKIFFNNVVNHLVDSNVFLRAMVLSMERFAEEDRAKAPKTQSQDPAEISVSPSGVVQNRPYPFAECKIARFLKHNHFRLVRDHMTVISIEDINQENICCVNTALVFFIFARRRGQLHSYLQMVREEERAEGRIGFICHNFRKLLWFWSEYYNQRGKDCLSLEFSSQIKFTEWMATYRDLVEELGEFDASPLMAALSAQVMK